MLQHYLRKLMLKPALVYEAACWCLLCRSKLEAVCQAMERYANNAQRLVQQDKSLTTAARAATAGPIPSIDQCLQGLQDIW